MEKLITISCLSKTIRDPTLRMWHLYRMHSIIGSKPHHKDKSTEAMTNSSLVERFDVPSHTPSVISLWRNPLPPHPLATPLRPNIWECGISIGCTRWIQTTPQRQINPSNDQLIPCWMFDVLSHPLSVISLTEKLITTSSLSKTIWDPTLRTGHLYRMHLVNPKHTTKTKQPKRWSTKPLLNTLMFQVILLVLSLW